MNHLELRAENERLREENGLYRARLAEFERCDTVPPDPPTSPVGYKLLSEQLRQLEGRIDTVVSDASTAARMASEVHRNLGEAVRLELSGLLDNFPAIVRGEVERVIRPFTERVERIESNLVELRNWKRDSPVDIVASACSVGLTRLCDG